MSLWGQENKKPQCVLMYIPCGNGGIKNGIQSHEVEIWTTLKISLHVCEAICGAINDSPTNCVGSHATSKHTTMWEPLFIIKIPILNGMFKIVCLGHVKIMGLII